MYTERETHQNENGGFTMNEKMTNQIAEMKKQTIGVEVEMNSIKREKAAKIAAEYFGTGRYEYTAGRNGYETWSAWDGEGREWKFQKDVSIAGPDSEKWKPCRNLSASSDTQAQRAMPQGDAGYTSISEQTATHHRRSATLPTSWQAMRA